MITGIFYLFVIFLALTWPYLLGGLVIAAFAYALLRNMKGRDDRPKVSGPRFAGLLGIAFAICFGVWFVYVMVATKGAPFGH